MTIAMLCYACRVLANLNPNPNLVMPNLNPNPNQAMPQLGSTGHKICVPQAGP